MNKLGLALLLGVVFLFCLYLPINVPRFPLYSFKTFIDDYIPLVTFFVTVYISYGIFLILGLIYFIKKTEIKILNAVLLSIIISCSFSYAIYILFQNYVDRPVIEPKNVFDSIYVWGNSWVAPYNAFPSLHVAITTIWVIGFWMIKSKLFKPVLIWGMLIIISTVLTKQHYFMDVVSGLALGIISYKLSEYLLYKFGRITR